LAPSPLRPTSSIYFFQLNTCSYSPYVTSSLMRLVCHLQLMLALASAVILGSKSRGTCDHILLSRIRDSPNLEGQVPILTFYIPQEQLGPVTPPRHWVPFSSPPTTHRARMEAFDPTSTWGNSLQQLNY
jgi:hypothetical protein